MTPEGKVKAAIKKFLQGLPHCWFCMPAANGYGSHGVPDFIVCYYGLFVALEAKRPGNLAGVTPLQRLQINAINQARGRAIAVDGVDAVRELFDKLDLYRKMVGYEQSA